MPELTKEEKLIFERTLATGNTDIFTEYFFQLPRSGTWYTPEDHATQYQMLYDTWTANGKPNGELPVLLESSEGGQAETTFIVEWDRAYHGNDPMFLLPHGFRMLPWLSEFLDPTVPLGIAITGTGTGKSQPLGAGILTPSGWSQMGDIRVGKYVIGADGTPKRVNGVYPQGMRPVYKVTFDDGSSTEADDEHLWAITRKTSGNYKVVRTCELRPSKRDFVRMVSPVHFYGGSLPAAPYLIGALLGDGSLTGETLQFSSADDEILARVSNELPERLSLKHYSNYDYGITRDELTGSLRNPLRTTLRELGILGKNSYEKFIPEMYLHASYYDRVALLQGLLDTDGCPSSPSGGIEFVTVSIKLAGDVRELARSLGGKCSISKKRIYTGVAYRLYINFHDPQFSPFYLSRKASAYKPKKYRVVRKIVSVEYIGLRECQCISVEDELYVTDDYIVTHNTCGVAIWALTMCALFPGFRFLNVAPSRTQAELMLNEVEKWCSNTRFRKFIKESPRGAHPLWVSRPHATMQIEVNDGYVSNFVCQTVNRDAKAVLGQEQDFISCDEAQLLENIDEALPVLATRMRGTRITGMPRWGMLRWISNPGKNPELMALMEYYGEIEEETGQAKVLEGIHSSVNIYITKRQLEKQKLSLVSQRSLDRWHGGETAAVYQDQEIPEEHLEACKDKELDAQVENIGRFDDLLGLRHYDLKCEPSHTYVVVGDVGKSNSVSLSSMNIPCVMVFDVTKFLRQPITLSAFHWFDGNGSYEPWLKTMQAMMLRYNASAYYDATSVQTAFEDVRGAAFDDWPTTPVFFSGSVVPKRWSLTIVNRLMADKMFRWPYIKGLWHQARMFEPRSTRIPDDIIATLMVFGLALRAEDTLWTMLEDRYKWKLDEGDSNDPTADFGKPVVYQGEEFVEDVDRYIGGDSYDRY